MSGYPEEDALDAAVRAAIAEDDPDHVVVAWVVVVASRSPHEDGTHMACFTADGQPHYSTVGLLFQSIDLVREDC